MSASDATRPQPAIGGPFELVDHHGREVSDRSYLGRPVVLLFGFTHCRVVCPRSLRKMSAVLDALGPEAERWAALYVTVDPERDDPAALRAFLQDHPRFTGLTGTRSQIDHVKDAYRVYARRRAEVDEDGNYEIAHTSLAYLLGADGSFAGHFPLVLDEAEIVARLRAFPN